MPKSYDLLETRTLEAARAQLLSRDRFERAAMGQHQFRLEAMPPPENPEKEKPKLPSFKKVAQLELRWKSVEL
jgi:hypothetical protein